MRVTIPATSVRVVDTALEILGDPDPLIRRFDVWFPTDARQRVLWPSEVHLSQGFFGSQEDIEMNQTAVAILVAGIIVAGTLVVGGTRAGQETDVGRFQLVASPTQNGAYRLDTVTGEISVCGVGHITIAMECTPPAPWAE